MRLSMAPVPQFAGKSWRAARGSIGANGDDGIVQHITDEAVAQRQPIDEGAKPTLNKLLVG